MIPKRRTILRLCLFLLLGAAVNIAVAWGFALCTVGGDPVPGKVFDALDMAEETRLTRLGWEQLPFVGRTRDVALVGIDTVAVGVARHRIDEWEDWRTANSNGIQCRTALEELSAGWPCLAITGLRFDASSPSGRIGGQRVWAYDGAICLHVSCDRLLPLRPLWPGFAINTIFYAVVCWLTFAAPFAVRRYRGGRRIKRGLCPACAYPVGTSDVCTECGRPIVSPRPVTPKSVDAPT